MPYQVKQLVTGLGEPVSAEPDDPIQEALNTMLKKGFSQLPVAQGDEYYFITQESILAAMHAFGLSPSDSSLRVADAMERVHRVFFESDDLFDLLKGMGESNAALVVDQNGRLKNIVTTYDTTQFFRQWTDDILHARDIEQNIKRVVNAAFKKSDGEIDETFRDEAIAEITPSNKDLRKKFCIAIKSYLNEFAQKGPTITDDILDKSFGEFVRQRAETSNSQEGWSNNEYSKFCTAATMCASEAFRNNLILDDQIVETAFNVLYNPREQIRPFEKLTLDQYIQLFLSDFCWGRCSESFGVNKVAITTLLSGIRDTRNKLAHFREEEITPQDRRQLKVCFDWLGEKIKPAIAELEKTAPAKFGKEC